MKKINKASAAGAVDPSSCCRKGGPRGCCAGVAGGGGGQGGEGGGGGRRGGGDVMMGLKIEIMLDIHLYVWGLCWMASLLEQHTFVFMYGK